MISAAILFLVIGLIAVAVGFGGVGGLAVNIGWVLLAIGVVLFLINAFTGRKVV